MKQIIIIILALSSLSTLAQQDPHYTQYMYNMNIINPAYAGSNETLSLGMLYRKQWVEIEDAPTVGTFSIHGPLGKGVGSGISALTDQIGPVEEQNIYGDFSYTLKLKGEHRVAFGIKTGATVHNVGLFSDIYDTLPDENDPAFSENFSKTYFNMGTGIFYYTNNYYLALSAPNILKSKHLNYNGRDFGSEVSHVFLTGGYVFSLSDNLKFKPFFMTKYAYAAPISLDISTNFFFYDKFEIGATYRIDDSFGALVNYTISKNLRIGYAYDHIVSDLNVTTPASHEIFLLFDLNLAKKVSSSPRYF